MDDETRLIEEVRGRDEVLVRTVNETWSRYGWEPFMMDGTLAMIFREWSWMRLATMGEATGHWPVTAVVAFFLEFLATDDHLRRAIDEAEAWIETRREWGLE